MGILDPLTNFPNGITTSVIVLTDYDYKDRQDGSIIFTEVEGSGVPFDTETALTLDTTLDITNSLLAAVYNGVLINTKITGTPTQGLAQVVGLGVVLDSTAVSTGTLVYGTGINIGTSSNPKLAAFTGINIADVVIGAPPPIAAANSAGIRIGKITHNSSGTENPAITSRAVELIVPDGRLIDGTGTAKNYGIYISGNGHAQATENWAIYSFSTAPSFLNGPLSLKEINPPIITGGTNSHVSALTVSSQIDVTGAVTSDFTGTTLNTTVTGTNTSSNIIVGLALNLNSSAVVAPTIRPLGIALDIFMTGASNFSTYTGIFFRGGNLPPPISGGYASQGISIAAITHDSVTGTSTTVRSLNVTLPNGNASAGGTVTNYGIHLNGNGHAQATENWALYSTSTAPSLLTGPLTVAAINDSANAPTSAFGSAAALTLNSTLNVTGGANATTLMGFYINALPTGVVSVSASAIAGAWIRLDFAGISGSKPTGHGLFIVPANITNKLASFNGIIVDAFNLGIQTAASNANGLTISQFQNNSSVGGAVVNKAINLTLPTGDASAGGTVNSYGIYIDGNGHASATANWAIYSLSTAPSSLAGTISVATAGLTFPSLPSGSASNIGLMVGQITGNTSGSGNASNFGLYAYMPAGTAAGGGTVRNYGLYIVGNGNAGATENWGVYYAGTAPSNFVGALSSASFTTAGALTAASLSSTLHNQTEVNGAQLQMRSLSENVTIAAAATSTSTIQIPADAVVLAVSARVTVTIPGPAISFNYGVTGTPARYGSSLSAVSPTTAPGTMAGPLYYAAATPILITPSTSPGSNAGRIRFTIHYYIATPATS